MVHQIRIYQIDPSKREAFHRRFADHAKRIMTERYGFQLLGIWERTNGEDLEFVYLLSWPDRATLDRQWAGMLSDPEWEQIKQRVRAEIGGEPVLKVSDYILDELPYSPGLVPGSAIEN